MTDPTLDPLRQPFMTRKQPQPPRKHARKAGKPASRSPKPPAPIAIAVRGKPEWRDWAKRLGLAAGKSNMNDAVQAALRLLAIEAGFTEPEPVRVDPRIKED
jgi:hypothetical protein